MIVECKADEIKQFSKFCANVSLQEYKKQNIKYIFVLLLVIF